MQQNTVKTWHPWAALGAAVLLAALVAAPYLRAAYAPLGDAPLMPVDDAYIHFQYARQIAEGRPYVYNTGLAPTTGATSLLYPYLLAAGYALGFTGLNLGLWSALIGAAALALCGWTVYRISRRVGLAFVPALLMQSALILNGALSWHAFSGMETALVVLFALLTFDAFSARALYRFTAAAVVLALLRPEASFMAAAAAVLYALRELVISRRFERRWLWLMLPVLAVGVQPLLNYLISGSFSAAGNQAKSLLSMIPAYPDVIASRILQNAARMASELFIGRGEFEIWYLQPLIAPLALIGAAVLVLRGRERWPVLLAAVWILLLVGAVSTLDTAFWHFKRYQMPMHALMFPLFALVIAALQGRWIRLGLAALVAALALPTLTAFVDYYGQNAASVAAQPYAMARALPTLTESDAVIAVHDVGMMRYLGERTTLDMVGLTTDGAAEYWRHGPGAVAEYLMRARPDYVAAYTDARGLSYLADTGLYGEERAGFTHTFDARYNVALGGAFQGIYAADYTGADAAPTAQQPHTLIYTDSLTLRDTLNVADLRDESVHGYTWSNAERLDGFATEAYEFIDSSGVQVLDGGRRINGHEAFTMHVPAGQDALLVTRVHPADGATLDIYANDQLVAQRVIWSQQGRWLELMTPIPAALVTSDALTIRIVPQVQGGHYMPYRHWIYTGTLPAFEAAPDAVASYQDGHVRLINYDVQMQEDQLMVTLTWWSDGQAEGDWMRFVHLYDDTNAPPVAQNDTRPLDGHYPPGNWLQGTFTERVAVQWPHDSENDLQLAVGFYNPLTFERLVPAAHQPQVREDAGRLFIKTVEISGGG